MVSPESGIYTMTETTLMALDAALEAAAGLLQKQLKEAPALIRPYSAYLASSTGKAMRARLLLSCSLSAEGTVSENAVKLAVALELLHLATLVHDDVMDTADYRRGQLTLQKKFGQRTAVICGDYLLAQALQLTAELAYTRSSNELDSHFMTSYVKRIALGELRQTINNGNFKLTVMDYLRIISGKTAALFEAASFGGALFGAEDPLKATELAAYRRFGRYLGMIFQLTDDCLDYESSRSAAGKNVRSDLEQAVVTLPLVYAMEEDPALQAFAMRAHSEPENKTVYERVRMTSALGRSRRLAGKYLKKAEKELQRLALPEEKRIALNELLYQANRQIPVQAVRKETIYA